MKLTKAQKKVVDLLKAGECIVHNDKNFIVSDGKNENIIQWRVWEFLTTNNIIIQEGFPFF